MTAGPSSEGKSPVRVFISYAWESVAYRRQVKRFATRLRADGVDARLDAWHLAKTTIPEFMNREVRHAEKILILCSPEYRIKVHEMEDGRISGVGWEAMLVTTSLYSTIIRTDRVEAVLMRGTWEESAPLFLKGMAYTDLSDSGRFEANYRTLLRRLTGHDEKVPPLGKLPPDIDPEPEEPLQGNVTGRDDDEGEESLRFSPPIDKYLKNSEYFQRLHKGVKRLTKQQHVVLDYLRLQKRVRISGSAGSGKTFVAAEKAIRLSKAGNVLFLCHNPQLASFIRTELTSGHSAVHVVDFCSWVRAIAGASEPPSVSWTLFDEPDQATLDSAAESLSKGRHRYHAVIVDEAQDFRDEWWEVVGAALRPGGTFYIFHDDNQSLLPRRGSYPIVNPQIDLSKNCRNDGRIFKLMRCLADSLPKAEMPSNGKTVLNVYQPGEEIQRFSKIVTEVFKRRLIENTVVLWAGTEAIEQAPMANCEFMVSDAEPWQREVTGQFDALLHRYDPRGLEFPPGGEPWVKNEIRGLSDAPYPTPDDIRRVQAIANAFKVGSDVHFKVVKKREFRRRFHWVSSGNTLTLQSAGTVRKQYLWGAQLVLYFQRSDWNKGIPEPTPVKIVPYYAPRDCRSMPLYSVADFKGLEADVVILCMRGRTPAHKEVIYVAVSRARAMLIVLADESSAGALPAFRWENSLTD